ncbi:Beta-barrel assembly machine subunit BamD [Lysobacter ruishenii]|uniref:Outer membrane protein assembly factor BamD n=2 Tax=Aerolutibacter ruishenii TaxID=686800 RepID=A0A562M2R8_9GAMM|nr:Beta-barrel assembly machine subunit BamD [Lysobacter ruishenii]
MPTMTQRSALLRTTALLLAITVAGSGCARMGKMFKDENANEGQPVEQLYDKGHTSMKNGNWASAEQTYKRLVAQYPYGEYTEQALIETAYAQFKSGKHDDAISSIDRFIRTYPTHRNIAYLYYLRGLANSNRDTVFLQRVWRLDASRRDMATPHQAHNDFSIVVDRYPNSRYAEDARKRMNELSDLFARHELDVALYYLRRTAYVASATRAKYLLDTYPQSTYENDAMATLAAAYTGLGNEALASEAKRVLQEKAPNHPYLAGKWPDYPGNWRKLNPFAGEKSALDMD